MMYTNHLTRHLLSYSKNRGSFHSLLAAAVIISLLLLCSCQHETSSSPEDDMFKAVREHMEQLVADSKVPSIAVAVARDGRIVWEEGFGLSDCEKNIAATEHTSYPLASISKPMTATGLMILVERGLIDPATPINNYLGKAKLQARVGDARGATVYRTATHTAGLPLHSRHFYADEHYQKPHMDETIRCYGNLITAPGERYQYSNLGYGLLGHIISRVSGKTYAEFMKEEVFVPLCMHHTSVYTGPDPDEEQAVKYTSDGSKIPVCESDSPGASMIYSSAHDLILFAMFHLKNDLPDQDKIITHAAIDTMHLPSPETGPTKKWEREGSGCGIGWFISVSQEGLRAVHHSGGTHGVSTVLALLPEEDIAVAVLSNTHSQWPEVIVIEVLRAMLPGRLGDIPPPVKTVDDQPFVPAPGLIGSWEGHVNTCEGEIGLVLDIENSGSIYARIEGQDRVRLNRVSYRADFPEFKNAGGGFFLRGWITGDLKTEDVKRGKPCKLWLELKLRGTALNGSLIAFSQRKNPTGPLTHWVDLKRR